MAQEPHEHTPFYRYVEGRTINTDIGHHRIPDEVETICTTCGEVLNSVEVKR